MEDKKNIVIMGWRDRWHPGEGGAERYIYEVAKYLTKEGFNVYFLTSIYPGAKKEEEREGIHYIRRGNPVTIYYILPRYFKKHLKKKTFLLIENFNSIPFRIPKYSDNTLTIIHHLPEKQEVWKSNYKFTDNKLLQSFLSLGIKINYTLGNPIGKFFLRQLFRLYSKNQKIITVSPSTKQELVSKGFVPDNISILYNGITLPIVKNISKPKDFINIASIGRVRSTKNIDKGIEMIKYTKEELDIKNIKLYIGGRGDAEEYLKELVHKYNLNNEVEFLGYISDEEKEKVLKKSHLSIQFSDKEGWGITTIEAASQATPTICYPVQGLKDSVKPSTGYLINDSLEEAWSRAIKDIRNLSPEYISKQKNCLEFAKEFKWGEQLKKLDKFL